MKIIEKLQLSNGAHNNIESESIKEIPQGWAQIPDDIEIPGSFPFVDIEVSDQTVTKMTEREIPKSEIIVDEDIDTSSESVSTDDLLEMIVDLEYRLTVLDMKGESNA